MEKAQKEPRERIEQTARGVPGPAPVPVPGPAMVPATGATPVAGSQQETLKQHQINLADVQSTVDRLVREALGTGSQSRGPLHRSLLWQGWVRDS